MAENRVSSAVITGASTGIGRATALHLAARGFRVFAGVRKESDADSLRDAGGDAVTPVLLDVTDAASVAAAAAVVTEEVGERGLDALVNNAGISINGPLELLPLDELRRQFDINVFGQIAVTQAFLPLLRVARGRIVNMSSIVGLVSLPMSGAYSASKFAVEALSDALRVELHDAGVRVIIIEPGPIRSLFFDKSLEQGDEVEAIFPPDYAEYYAPMSKAIRAGVHWSVRIAGPPELVARRIGRALTARRPRTRYLVGPASHSSALFAMLPDRMRDFLFRLSRKLAR